MTKIKILLAEDEASLGMIVKESLESRDFNVFLASNGEEAFKIYQKEKPDILVLDVMMPKKDGFTLAKEIRLQNKRIPIIFLTAKSQTSDVLEGFQLGGNDYLKKPFSMEELIVRIKSLLNRSEFQINLETIEIGKYQFNFTKQTLSFNEKTFQLTSREAELLFNCQKRKMSCWIEPSFLINSGGMTIFSMPEAWMFLSVNSEKNYNMIQIFTS